MIPKKFNKLIFTTQSFKIHFHHLYQNHQQYLKLILKYLYKAILLFP